MDSFSILVYYFHSDIPCFKLQFYEEIEKNKKNKEKQKKFETKAIAEIGITCTQSQLLISVRK